MKIGQLELIEDPAQPGRWFFNRKNAAGERLVLEVLSTPSGMRASSAKLYGLKSFSYEEMHVETDAAACADLLALLELRRWNLSDFVP